MHVHRSPHVSVVKDPHSNPNRPPLSRPPHKVGFYPIAPGPPHHVVCKPRIKRSTQSAKDNPEAQEHCSRGNLQSHTEVAAAVKELQLSSLNCVTQNNPGIEK
jgi:hypothetical protein